MMTTMAILAILLIVLRVPLWLIFLLVSMTAIHFHLPVPPAIVASAMFGALDKFVLLAVPGFIFAGTVMGLSGMTDRLIVWLRTLVGRVPGGLPITTLGAAEMFGAISGSSAASTAAIGKFLYPGLRETGYTERFSLGLISSSGAIAIIIPPSISMILFAAVSGASVGALFIAGVLPGLLLGVLVSVYSIYVSYRNGITRSEARWSAAEVAKATVNAAPVLGLPIIIFGGIYGGYVTATEAAALASLYSVIIALSLRWRSFGFRGIGNAAIETGLITAKILIVTASAGLFARVLTVARVPNDLAALVDGFGLPWWGVLLAINLVLILAGMFIDPVSNVVVLTPLLWPLAEAAGINLIHFGVLMVINMAIGMFTPPLGLNLFVCSSIFNVSLTRISRGVAPFAAIYAVGLLIVTYVPAISLWLPGWWLQ